MKRKLLICFMLICMLSANNLQIRRKNSRLRGANGCFVGHVCHIYGRRGGTYQKRRRDGRPCAEVCQARASSRKARRALSTACSRRSVLSTRASAQES